MAKKNFKGGLDSLIENSLGIRKSSKKGELKGNPIDMVKPESTNNSTKDNNNTQNTPKTETAPVDKVPQNETVSATTTESVSATATETATATVSEVATATISETATATVETKNENIQETNSDNVVATKTQPVEEKLSETTTEPTTTNDKQSENPVQNTTTSNQESETNVAEQKKSEPTENQEVKSEVVKKQYSTEVLPDDTETNAYLKNLVSDLRHELYLWRNGKINVQSFNASLHAHRLKYNPTNNEIEEF